MNVPHLPELKEGRFILVSGRVSISQEAHWAHVAFDRNVDQGQAVWQAIDERVQLLWNNDLRAKLTECLDSERDALLIQKIPSVLELFPEHQGQCPSSYPDRYLRESLERILTCLGPLVWFLEDLHWAGPISLDLLEPLARYPVLATCHHVDHRLSLTIREMEDIELVRVNLDSDTASLLEDSVTAGSPGEPQSLRAEERVATSFAVKQPGTPADTSPPSLDELDSEEQRVLELAACYGLDFAIHPLEICYDGSLPTVLERLEKKGFIRCYRANHWRFVDEGIQETAYGWLVQPEELHMRNGRRLWNAYVLEEMTDIFPIVSQLCRAANLLNDEAERIRVASLLLHGAQEASSASYFDVAASYLDVALDLVSQSPRHWRDEYYLSLNVWETTAEVQIRTGNIDRAEQLLSVVMENARSLEDKTMALTLYVIIAGCRNDPRSAVDKALKSLELFGVTFKKNLLLPRVVFRYLWFRRVLVRTSDETFQRLPICQDSRELAQQRLMLLAHEYAIFTNPTLSALISMHMMQKTLNTGMSVIAAGACVSMAMMICGGFGDIELGSRYSDLGLKVLDGFGKRGREILPRIAAGSYVFVQLHSEPVSSVLKSLLAVHRYGLGSGDIESSMVIAAIYAHMALFACVPLQQLQEDISIFVELMKRHNQKTSLQLILPAQQFVLNMLGKSSSPSELTGDALEEASFLEDIDARGGTAVREVFVQLKLFLKSYFGVATSDLLKTMPNFLSDSTDPYSVGLVHLHTGLAHVASNKRWKARRCLRRLRKLTARNERAFGNKALLLEYALSRNRGALDESVVRASEEGLWSEVGLAYEWAGEWELAAKAYERWGAMAKVIQVREKGRGSTSDTVSRGSD